MLKKLVIKTALVLLIVFIVFRMIDFLFTKHPNYIGSVQADIVNRALLLKTSNYQNDPGPTIVTQPRKTDFCNHETIINSNKYPSCFIADANWRTIYCNFFIRLIGVKCGNITMTNNIYKIPEFRSKIDKAINKPCEFAYNPKSNKEIFTYHLKLNRKDRRKYEYDKSRPLKPTKTGQGMISDIDSPWHLFKCDHWDFLKSEYITDKNPLDFMLLEIEIIANDSNSKDSRINKVISKNTIILN